MRKKVTIEQLAEGIFEGERRALAKAITLVESTKLDDQEQATKLMDLLVVKKSSSIRIGITGSPGVGKSTFIEALGLWLIAGGKKVAVLAVDPSSALTGGSILGDKTRMQKLSNHKSAFVRPSPSVGVLGGVTSTTRETVLLCEAFGFDVILVETVGVGQSEFIVSGMVDVFTLLLQPGAGDDLQAVKKGIVELADIIAINKSDGDLQEKAELSKRQFVRSLSLVRQKNKDWKTPVLQISSLKQIGIQKFWDSVLEFISIQEKSPLLNQQRSTQDKQWFWEEVSRVWLQKIKSNPEAQKSAQKLFSQIDKKEISVLKAAADFTVSI